MGSHAPHGAFFNLYINGVHWGMYGVHERADDSFAASYLGGDKRDYDLFKHSGGQVMEGNALAWNEMRGLALEDLGNESNYAALAALLDLGDFCDYMLMNFYVGNDDWPHHNWYAARNRVMPGAAFCSWMAQGTRNSQAAMIDGPET